MSKNTNPWFVVDQFDNVIEGPMSARKAKDKAIELNNKTREYNQGLNEIEHLHDVRHDNTIYDVMHKDDLWGDEN